MEHILEHIKSSRVIANTRPDEFDHEQRQIDHDESSSHASDEAEDEAEEDQLSKARKQKRLQTMVFSATLTLPQRLRSRFKKGL